MILMVDRPCPIFDIIAPTAVFLEFDPVVSAPILVRLRPLYYAWPKVQHLKPVEF
jgi:hypothetical protein